MGNMADYKNGFSGGVAIRGMPILNSYSSRNVWWVDSGGAQNSDGSFNRPFSTVDTAINHASVNDLIMVKAGHAETLVAAGAVTQDVAGVAIVGLGQGSKRPTFTFTPAAVGTNNWAISAAGCSVQNIIGIAGLDAITNPFNVSAAACYLDIDWQDGSSAIEAATVILTTAAADQLTVKLTYRGFPAGNACVSPIQLVGVTDGRVAVDFYGLASLAVVEFLTTLSTNVHVTGYAYNSTDTTGAKLVVDTVTNSLWYADIEAGAAGARISGGSGGALAVDDLGAVSSKASSIGVQGSTITSALVVANSSALSIGVLQSTANSALVVANSSALSIGINQSTAASIAVVTLSTINSRFTVIDDQVS